MKPLRCRLRPVELAMRVAVLQSVSVSMLCARFDLSRASAYRYVRMWCELHGVPAPAELPTQRFADVPAPDWVYRRRPSPWASLMQPVQSPAATAGEQLRASFP